MGVIDNIYMLKNKEMPWGDWGDILWEGITRYDQKNNSVFIERAGPFSPYIYISNNYFIFTDNARSLYEDSLLSGVSFLYEIPKSKIVKIDWHNWDEKQDITNYLDIEGEPEDIILNEKMMSH